MDVAAIAVSFRKMKKASSYAFVVKVWLVGPNRTLYG